MFSKKAMSLLLSVALAITSVMPVFANEGNIDVEFNETDVVESQELSKTDYWQGDFIPVVRSFGTDTPLGAYDWGYIKQNDGSYNNVVITPLWKKREQIDFSYDYSDQDWEEFIDDSDPGLPVKSKRITFSANEKNSYTITTPKLKVNGGFEHTGWGYNFTTNVQAGNPIPFYPEYVIPAGTSFTFDETMPMKKNTEYRLTFVPILEYSAQSINEKFQTVSFNEGGHTVSANINVTPAYTGSKIKAGDVIEYMEVDGKKIAADDVKVKVDKNKAIGSTVEVKIQKIKGLDKQTNKLLKGKSLGSVTIRPIVAQELLTSPTKTYSKEGQVYVKAKGSKAKAAYVYVPKKGKYSDSKKVKKIKLKKGTYTYNSSTPAVTFNSDLISGSAVAGK